MKKPNILVIDGQGGKIGSAMLDALKTSLAAGGIDAELTAVGTNSIATANMLKSSPDAAATGENPVVVTEQHPLRLLLIELERRRERRVNP